MNKKLFFSNIRIMLITIIIFIGLGIGFFFVFRTLYDDYTYEVKIAQVCIDPNFECADADKEINKFNSYLADIELFDTVVSRINTESGNHYNIQEVQAQTSATNGDGYFLLKVKSDDVYLISSLGKNLVQAINTKSQVSDKIKYEPAMYTLKPNVSLMRSIQVGAITGSFFGILFILSRKK